MAIIIIIPYRDRLPQLQALLKRLQDFPVYKIIVCEQAQGLPFNRGQIKNIGFLLAHAAPHDSVYFHDVDVFPGPRFKQYPSVNANAVCHLYGHVHSCGGIVGFQAQTFRYLNGFCGQLWCWGGEDTLLYQTCCAQKIKVDRTHFGLRFHCFSYVSELNLKGTPQSDLTSAAEFQRAITLKTKEIPVLPKTQVADLKTTMWSLSHQIYSRYSNVFHYVVHPMKKN